MARACFLTLWLTSQVVASVGPFLAFQFVPIGVMVWVISLLWGTFASGSSLSLHFGHSSQGSLILFHQLLGVHALECCLAYVPTLSMPRELSLEFGLASRDPPAPCLMSCP